ncbi:hypothetical protein ACH5RR_003486 [Cinchona calisaya]|uniref:RNase H type-1 domain-containing protein n=1 Tax=Cinchona calisaya TaxID=153742 RepID=A0ABD3AV55_9GENT
MLHGRGSGAICLPCNVRIVACPSPSLVSWIKPSHGRFKLNVDSSSLGNGLASRGAILRDSLGHLILALSLHYNLLPRIGSSSVSSPFFSPYNPIVLEGILCLDKEGVPSVRSRGF